MSKIDPQDILRSADSFSAACKTLQDAATQGRAVVIEIVLATLEALTVELYLKCLIMLESGQYRSGHDLYKFFKCLAPQTRSELQQAHDVYLTRWPAVVAAIKAKGYKTDLESLLIAGRHAFTDFRYAHEAGSKKARGKQNVMFGLHGLAVCIRARIMKLKPDWEVSTWKRLNGTLDLSTSRTHRTGEPGA
jgi:hypothetical protein